jgi:hypothetical protein
MIATDILETIVGSSPVTDKHDALLAAISRETPLERIAFITKRDHFVPRPHRILGRDGSKIVSHNFKEWMQDKLDQQRGDHLAVW